MNRYDFNEILRRAVKIEIDNRGMDTNLDPHIQITLDTGEIVLISDEGFGRDIKNDPSSIQWAYEDECGMPPF